MKYLKIIIDKIIINKQIMKKLWDQNNKYFVLNYNNTTVTFNVLW